MFFEVEVCHHSANSGEAPDTILHDLMCCCSRAVLHLPYNVIELVSISRCMEVLDHKSFNLGILKSRTKTITLFYSFQAL